VAANDLTYHEYTSTTDPCYLDFKPIKEHFVAFPIGDWHLSIDRIHNQIISGAETKLSSINFMQYHQVNQCHFDIAQRCHFLSQEIKNKKSV